MLTHSQYSTTSGTWKACSSATHASRATNATHRVHKEVQNTTTTSYTREASFQLAHTKTTRHNANIDQTVTNVSSRDKFSTLSSMKLALLNTIYMTSVIGGRMIRRIWVMLIRGVKIRLGWLITWMIHMFRAIGISSPRNGNHATRKCLRRISVGRTRITWCLSWLRIILEL